MNPKANPLLLAMFTLMCATIPAAGVIPSVIAQEYTTSLGEDFAGSIVSDVLDGDDDDEVDDEAADDGIVDQDLTDTAAASNPNQDETAVDQAGSNQFGDQTNTQIAIPITEQDQRAENQAAQLGLNLDLDSTLSPVPTDPTTPECPPEFTFNPATNLCERTVTQDPECPPEFTFNPETDLCESGTAPICEPGEFNPATDQCEIAPVCAPGEFNPETDQCGSAPICEAGEFNPETDQCDIAPECAAG